MYSSVAVHLHSCVTVTTGHVFTKYFDIHKKQWVFLLCLQNLCVKTISMLCLMGVPLVFSWGLLPFCMGVDLVG